MTITQFLNSAVLPGYLFGLTLSNDATSPNTVVDISPGMAAEDDLGLLMPFPTAFTKVLASTWAAGSGANGLDTGSPAASKTYHAFVIQKDADGSTDILLSLSATSPTMPLGYTNKRRIGAVITDANTHILAFSQLGDEFLLVNPVNDVNVLNLGTTPTLYPLTVPAGIKVNATIRVRALNTTADENVLVSSPDEASGPADSPASNDSLVLQNSGIPIAGQFNVRTDTSAQIRAVSGIASTEFQVVTYGWIDTRGRLG